MIKKFFDFLFELIDKYGQPVETRGKRTEEVLRQKQEYEELARHDGRVDPDKRP